MIGYINNFLCLHQFSVIRIPVDVDVHVGALDCGQHQRVIILIQLCFVTVYYRGCLVIKTKKKKKKGTEKELFLLLLLACGQFHKRSKLRSLSLCRSSTSNVSEMLRQTSNVACDKDVIGLTFFFFFYTRG